MDDKSIQPKTEKQMSEEDKINLCRGASIILLGVMLLFFFFGWCYIYNSKYGVEVGCSGWNFICQSFCWNFKSDSKVFGDMAIPFYYYAKYHVITLEIVTTVIFYLTIILIILAVINLVKPYITVTQISLIISSLYSVVILAAFIVALAMNGSKILPKYCSNNPACSIQSLIIFPFLLSLGILAVNIVLFRKLVIRKTR